MFKNLVIQCLFGFFSIFLIKNNLVHGGIFDRIEKYENEKGAKVAVYQHQERPFDTKTLEFKATEKDGVSFSGEIKFGLKGGFNSPYGEHEIHIHQRGSFNPPTGTFEKADCSKVGYRTHQLGKVEIDTFGRGQVDFRGQNLEFEGSNSIIGKVLVIHKKNDRGDGTGEACGLIVEAEYPGWRLKPTEAPSDFENKLKDAVKDGINKANIKITVYELEKGATARVRKHGKWNFEKPLFFNATKNGNMNVVGSLNFIGDNNGDRHAVHIHERGTFNEPASKFTDPDCSSVGSFVKDLGTVTLGITSSAEINFKDMDLKVTGPNSIIGKVVVLHRKDDNSEGTPYACGIIEEAENSGWREKNSGNSIKLSSIFMVLSLAIIIFK